MPKKETLEKEKKSEDRVVDEPIDEKAKKIMLAEDEYKEAAPVEEAAAVAPQPRRRLSEEERMKIDREESLAKWKPKRKLGMLVQTGQIKNIDEVFEKGFKILEQQVVDTLLPDLKADLLLIGQAKGKFGGGKRRFWRQTQRKTAEGNVPSFACMVVVGDGNGHVGVGIGKAGETLPAKEKAIRQAKLNLIKVIRGCGSFDCSCSEKHSIPTKVEGKVGSSRIKLMPASKGTGLVIDGECKKIMTAAGIKDVYSMTFGQTRTKINLAVACFEALKNLARIKR